MLKTIFRVVRIILFTIIILALLLYPIVVLHVEPFTFYWDKFVILFESIASFQFFEKISMIFKLKFGG